MRTKIYSFYMVIIGLVTVIEVDHEWTYYASIIIAAAVCFAVTYYGDVDNPNRPKIKYRISCSTAAAYLAYFLYPSVKDVNFDLILFSFHPFQMVQVFVGLCSFFGITIFKEISALQSFGWKVYLGKLGDKLKAISKKP